MVYKETTSHACIRIQLGMYFARAICCFDGPRGKRAKHLSSGNLLPKHTLTKKYVSSSLKAFEFLIKLLSDLMLVLGDEAGPAYLPVFLQLVMCCTAGSIDSG